MLKKRKNSFFLFCTLFCFSGVAQSNEPETIKIRKYDELVKAAYEASEHKLIALDRYGNPKEEAISSFEIHYVHKKKLKVFKIAGNKISAEALKELNKYTEAKKLFFTKIVAQDSEGHFTPLPDVIEFYFPECQSNK